MLRVVVFLCVCRFVVPELHEPRTQFKSSLSKNKNRYDNINEDARLQVPRLVRKYGYPLEVHRVTTKDGYILTMHRIPHGRRNNTSSHRSIVFLMHGLLCSSADWVLMGPMKGLAYILAEEGFDVWLGNARGNHYSRKHVSLNPDSDLAFWKFSWDEIGITDLPAMIDYALKKTRKRKLHYIGHSQGTTSFFVMCSLRPKYNEKIISMTAMGPVAYMAHSGCQLFRKIATYSRSIDLLFELIGNGEILPNTVTMRWAGQELCRDQAITQELCADLIFLIAGWNSLEFNRTMLPVIIGHTPAGSSVRQFVHYAQSMIGKEFRRYDHGIRNIKVYGTRKPPPYDLSKVTAPVYLQYSLSDPFAHVKDVRRLSKELGNVKSKEIVPMRSFSHLDFLWGIDAKKLVYDRVVSDMIASEHQCSFNR